VEVPLQQMRENVYTTGLPKNRYAIWQWSSELGCLVALGQNVLKVKQGLQQVFKLDVPQPTIYRFKAAVANRYKATNISILDDLLGGPSLSIDETEVRLVNATGHVWVFAGISGAYYEYRESPNGQFLTERL
jgi:hypothetical protein